MKATVKNPGLLLDFLLEMMRTDKKKSARQLLKFGQVSIDGLVVKRGDATINPGQLVEISKAVKPAEKLTGAPKGAFPVLFEDADIIVVQKPSGLLSIASDFEKKETLQNLLSSYVDRVEGGRVYVVHRLDRNVGGVMVFAKNLQAKSDIQANWDTAQKKYVALVEGKPKQPQGRIETWLEEITPYKVAVAKESPNAKLSITDYSTRKSYEKHSLLDIDLQSGRRHQIRVHLAHLGCPIVGDRVYGTGIPGSNDIFLFAYYLSFRHPTTGRMVNFQAPIPNWKPSRLKATAKPPVKAPGKAPVKAPAAGSGKKKPPSRKK